MVQQIFLSSTPNNRPPYGQTKLTITKQTCASRQQPLKPDCLGGMLRLWRPLRKQEQTWHVRIFDTNLWVHHDPSQSIWFTDVHACSTVSMGKGPGWAHLVLLLASVAVVHPTSSDIIRHHPTMGCCPTISPRLYHFPVASRNFKWS